MAPPKPTKGNTQEGTSGRKVTQKIRRSQAKGKEKAVEPTPEVPTPEVPPPEVPPTSTDKSTKPIDFDIVLETEEQRKRFDKLMKRGVSATRYGDPKILDAMGIRQNILELLEAAGLVQCLAPRPTFLKFVLEFFSTLEIEEEVLSGFPVHHFKFQLLNEQKTLSHDNLQNIYGFKPRAYGDNSGLREFNVQQFWEQITAAPGIVAPQAYDPRGSRLTAIRNPVVKYLQKLLSSTICGRKEISSPRLYEMEILWAIVDRRKRDFQKDLASCFQKIVKELKTERKRETKVPDPIYCGALITPILEHYNVPLPEYTPITTDYYLDWEEMENMRIAMLGYKEGISGPAVPYVLQNEGPYLRLPNPGLTYITHLASTLNLELSSEAHINASLEPNREELTKFKRVKKPRPVARVRSVGVEGEENSQPAQPSRKRSSTAILTQSEFQERQEGLMAAMGDEIKGVRAELVELRASIGAELRGIKETIQENQTKILDLFKSIKGCFTGSSSRPSRSL